MDITKEIERNLKINYTCCFTGHRPNKLTIDMERLKKDLMSKILHAVYSGYKYFISGCGLGVDLLAAECVLFLRQDYDIKLTLAIPCKTHYLLWNHTQKKNFFDIRQAADELIYVSENEYTQSCMQKRNEYMVESSSLLIAVYNGTSGGTKNTIEYAKKTFCNIEYILI